MLNSSRKAAQSFLGLNNVGDPHRLGLRWLTQADNVDITNNNALQRAKGFARVANNTAVTGAYATQDFQRLYIADNGGLYLITAADLSGPTLQTTLTSSRPVYFAEANNIVYYTNGIDYGSAPPGGWRPWGIPNPRAPVFTLGNGSLDAGLYAVVCTFVDNKGLESGNSPPLEITVPANKALLIADIEQRTGYTTNIYVTMPNATIYYLIAENAPAAVNWGGGTLGRELPYWNTSPPRGSFPALFQGQLYCAEPFQAQDISIIWRSLPLHYHHFDYSKEGFVVTGEVLFMHSPDDKTLIIGTDADVIAFDGDKQWSLSGYGVVPGWHASINAGKLYFWTLRGLCRAMPFENLTESSVSVPPGLSAGGMVLEKDGMRRYVVALQKGGEAYNRRSS